MRKKSKRTWTPHAKRHVRESAPVEFDPMCPRMNSADATICERRWREWWQGFLTVYLGNQGLPLHPTLEQLRKKHRTALGGLLRASVSIRTVRRSCLDDPLLDDGERAERLRVHLERKRTFQAREIKKLRRPLGNGAAYDFETT